MKSLVGRLLFNTPLYPFARSLYRKVKRGPAKVNSGEVAFNATLVRPGDLVFDVDANVGQKTEVFLAWGPGGSRWSPIRSVGRSSITSSDRTRT